MVSSRQDVAPGVWVTFLPGTGVAVALNFLVLFRARDWVAQAPMYKTEMGVEGLITEIESATSSNLAVLSWGWIRCRPAWGFAFMSSAVTFYGLESHAPFGRFTTNVFGLLRIAIGLAVLPQLGLVAGVQMLEGQLSQTTSCG